MNLLFKKVLKLSFIATLSVVTLTGCTKSEINNEIPDSTGIRVLITNQGQFTQATASLTTITYDNQVTNDVFRGVNGRPLGDVAQSITEVGDNYYVVLNNSKKIEVFNKTTFRSVETIPTIDATIPTYIASIGNDTIAVTEKKSGNLMLININNMGTAGAKREMRVVRSVGAGNQMKVVGNKLFIAGGDLRVFDIDNIQTDKMRTVKDLKGETVIVPDDSKILVDKNKKIWVIHTTFYPASNKLVCIDPTTEKAIKELPFEGFSVDGWSPLIDISPDGERLYLTGKIGTDRGILKVSINDAKIEPKLIITYNQVRELFGMSVSPEETIFISDVEWTITRGKIHEYALDGTLLHTSEAGIFPSFFLFTKK